MSPALQRYTEMLAALEKRRIAEGGRLELEEGQRWDDKLDLLWGDLTPDEQATVQTLAQGNYQ